METKVIYGKVSNRVGGEGGYWSEGVRVEKEGEGREVIM